MKWTNFDYLLPFSSVCMKCECIFLFLWATLFLSPFAAFCLCNWLFIKSARNIYLQFERLFFCEWIFHLLPFFICVLINGSILCLKFVFFLSFNFVCLRNDLSHFSRVCQIYELNESACISIHLANNSFSLWHREQCERKSEKNNHALNTIETASI